MLARVGRVARTTHVAVVRWRLAVSSAPDDELVLRAVDRTGAYAALRAEPFRIEASDDRPAKEETR
jgi:hypothetical protein